MLKKLLYLSPIFLLTSAAMEINSNSAPTSSSGAPGETNCTTSGCHQSFPVNSGPGQASIGITNVPSVYIPGTTYTINVEVDQANLVRFGYQMVALKDLDNSNTGTLQTLDGSRTQVMPGDGNFASRKYMTYTFKGTSAINTPGVGKWSFTWTAPGTPEGPVTLYLATIAANNDGTDLGDYCYTKTLSIAGPNPPVLNSDFTFDIFPVPSKDNITARYNLPIAGTVKIDLFDLHGKLMEELFSASLDAGEYSTPLNYVNQYPKGIYFIRLIYNDKAVWKKIFYSN